MKTAAEQLPAQGTFTSIEDFVDAKLSKGGNVAALEGEVELKRSTVLWANSTPATVTLTNQRLLLLASNGSAPQQLSLSSIKQAKGLNGGLLAGKAKKTAMSTTLKLKLSDDTKYEMKFTQPPASLFTATEERDMFLKLLQDKLGQSAGIDQ